MAIGVFDSGVGGLTVHHRLVERFPTADFVYLADQANAPYGGRPGEEIVTLTRAGCERLFEAGCDPVLQASTTRSQPATPPRRWRFDGCSRPGCPATGASSGGR